MATPLPIVSEEQDGAFPDPVLRYIVAIRPMQDGLRRALIHLSGFALERITHQGHGQIGYGLVESARFVFGGIYEGDAVRRYLGPAGVYVRSEDNGWYVAGCLLSKDVE